MQMECQILVAVFAVMLTAAIGSSNADSCTASLPAVVIRGEDECPVSGGNTAMDEIRQNVSTLLQEVVRCKYLVNSCAKFAKRMPNSPSGNYWILNSTESPVQVFCEMGEVFPANLTVTKGWMRVASLNMTDPNQQCPGNLQLSFTNPKRLCGRRRTDRGCDSVTFPTYGVQYQQVCGRVRGYQVASSDAFSIHDCQSCTTIDHPYVDGISITHGLSPRNHIWTYAAGTYENYTEASTCPCTGSGALPPNFVGSDYYCESGLNAPPWSNVLYSDDPLWDGQDCNGLEGTCCDPPNLPWFCKKLPEPTTDDLEFRTCGDAPRNSEDTPIELVELYIQ